MNRIIKMQEEEYPLSSPSYDHAFFNHCLTTFYDQDSNDDIIQARCSTQQVMFYLQNNIDICDTPLGEILRFVQVNLAFKNVDLDLLKRKILKQKSIIKRSRAKNRKNPNHIKKTYPVITITEEDEEETKKQRNRISAQISRDKKKLRVKELEEMNKKLQQECNLQKIQNQQLKQTLLTNKAKNSQAFTSKISKMLIFLGIICLFGIIRDIFLAKQNTQTPISKIADSLPAPASLKQDLSYLDHSEQKGRMLELIEAPLVEMFEPSLANKLKDRLRGKFSEWTEGSAFVPERVRRQIEDIRSRALH